MGRRSNNGPSLSGGGYIHPAGIHYNDRLLEASVEAALMRRNGPVLSIEALLQKPKQKVKRTAKEFIKMHLDSLQIKLNELSRINAQKKARLLAAKKKQRRKQRAERS